LQQLIGGLLRPDQQLLAKFRHGGAQFSRGEASVLAEQLPHAGLKLLVCGGGADGLSKFRELLAGLGGLLFLGDGDGSVEPPAGKALQGDEQKEAKGSSECPAAEGFPACPEAVVAGIDPHRQPQQKGTHEGQGGVVDQRRDQSQLPLGIEELGRQGGGEHSSEEHHQQHDREDRQQMGEGGVGGDCVGGAAGHGRCRGDNAGMVEINEIAPLPIGKGPPEGAGYRSARRESGGSGFGSGDALPELAAVAEGGGSTQERDGAWYGVRTAGVRNAGEHNIACWHIVIEGLHCHQIDTIAPGDWNTDGATKCGRAKTQSAVDVSTCKVAVPIAWLKAVTVYRKT